MIRTAILIDGGFYRKRAKAIKGELSGEERAKELFQYCMGHIYPKNNDKKNDHSLNEQQSLYKKQVDRIILIAGDSDFVPAAKLARREGLDFILDPMWSPINDRLFEHIDGLYSVWPDPSKKNK